MGRNSEKRRQKRDQREQDETQVRQARSAEAAVLSHGGAVGAVPWWAESLRREGFDDGPDPTLAAALFRVSALLVTRSMAAPLEGSALGPVVDELAKLLSVDTLSLHRLSDDDDELRVDRVATSARLRSDDPLLTFAPGDSLVDEALETGRPVRVDDPARDPRCERAHGQRSHVGSLLVAPLLYRREALGLLVATRKEVRGFYDADERRVELVSAALAQDLEQARLLRAALVDPETGLMSRMALLEALPREVERARRYGTPLSVLMLHLDGLRSIADTYGIVVTRELMAEVGRRLPTRVRRADLTVRFGADVFLVLSPVGAADAARGCERLMQAVTDGPFVAGDVQIPLSVSASAATLEDEDSGALSLLLRAEASLPVPVVTAPSRPEGAVDPVSRRG